MIQKKLKPKRKTKRLTFRDSEAVKGILEELGYKLVDCGRSWRTQALFRDGSNPISIQVYKDSGVWIDFASGSDGKPLEYLIDLTIGRDQAQSFLKRIEENQTESIITSKQGKFITMDKVYPESDLEMLFPNHFFYKKRGISDETQKVFKLGMATQGKMYRRIVFPIYNCDGQIIGFSGRHVDDHPIKWKHIGKKKKWIYPAFVPAEVTVDEILDRVDEVFIVESIGDAMAMYEQGIKNVLVSFGVIVSPSLLIYLSGKSFKNIVLVPNNDRQSAKNNGLIGGVASMMKLSKYFNLDQITMRLPPNKHNDIGAAHADGEDLRKWENQQVDREAQIKFITNLVRKESSLNKDTARARQFIKFLNA